MAKNFFICNAGLSDVQQVDENTYQHWYDEEGSKIRKENYFPEIGAKLVIYFQGDLVEDDEVDDPKVFYVLETEMTDNDYDSLIDQNINEEKELQIWKQQALGREYKGFQ